MDQLNGKAVLITGGGTGIGRAIAESFAQKGAKVLITGRREAPLKEVSQAFENIKYVQADVTKADDRKNALQAIITKFGKLDILVNNAGVGYQKSFTELTDEDIETTLKTNLLAPITLSRDAVPYLSESKGSIVNISTVAAQGVMPGLAPYGASKAGLNHLTRLLAAELGPLGIRVNAVAPGVTKTDMAAGMIEQMEEQMLQMTPLGRLGNPEDIANAVLLVSNGNAGWVTGQILEASGGFLL